MKRVVAGLGVWLLVAASASAQTSALEQDGATSSLQSAVLEAKQAAIDAREAAVKAGEAALRAQGGSAANYQGIDTQADTPQRRFLENARRTSEQRRARIEWRRWIGQPASRPNVAVTLDPFYDPLIRNNAFGGYLSPSAYWGSPFWSYGFGVPTYSPASWYSR